MIRDDIKAALVAAMKGGDKAGTSTIRLIQSAIKNRDIELRTASQQPDDDALVTEVLQKMIKQRRESVELYRKGNRDDLARKEEAELEVLKRWLPQRLSDEEVKNIIQASIAEAGAQGVQDLGKVMKLVMPKVSGRSDGKQVSELAKALLAG